MLPPSDLTCAHQPSGVPGLCDDCRAAWDEDPKSYFEYGDHPDGLRRWAELQAEMDRYRHPEPSRSSADVPF